MTRVDVHIAVRTGRTRESVRLLVSGERGPGGFPPPDTDPRSRCRLWRAAGVDGWYRDQLGTHLEDVRGGHRKAAINAGLELWRHRGVRTDGPRADLRTVVGL